MNTKTGDDIVIEERPANELTTLVGPLLNESGKVGEKLTVELLRLEYLFGIQHLMSLLMN